MAWDVFSAVAAHLTMQSWVETPALITRAELAVRPGDEGGTTFQATAEYEYQYLGQPYRGSRVSPHALSDNLGDYQQHIYRELRSYQTANQQFRCYANPNRPDESILYRDLRWEMITFEDIVILTFGGFGGAMLLGCFFTQRQARARANLAAAHPDEPWLWRSDWASAQVENSENIRLWTFCGAALFWNLATAPLWYLLPPEIMNGNYVSLLAAILPAIGVVIAKSAMSLLLRRMKYGECVFQMESVPGVIGGELIGDISTSRNIETAGRVNLLLCCQSKAFKGDDSFETTKELWRSEHFVAPSGAADGTGAIPVRFAIPNDCRPSDNAGEGTTEWHLTATADSPGVKFKCAFLIPVFGKADAHP